VSLRRKLAWVAVLYLAEGFPFGLMADNLPVYLRAQGASLVAIGFLQALGLPWTLKVLWAPAVDRFGERRQWISVALVVMAVATAMIPLADASTPGLFLWAVLLVLTIGSATQDVAIDAYTIGLLAPGEEGVANGVRVSAYRVALIVSGGALVILAEPLGWTPIFWIAALTLAVLAAVTWRAPRVARVRQPAAEWARTLGAWLRRPGAPFVLAFVLLYKLGDTSMGPMVKPFWVDSGLSTTEIGLVSTTLGIGASIAGALAGGVFTSRFGIFRGLWMLGALQALSNLGYAGAAAAGGPRLAIYAASLVESFTGGLGTAAFLAFLMHVCEREQAATQYALLSALFGLTRSLAGAVSGVGAETLGYAPFFTLTFVLAFPSFALLPWVRLWIHDPPSRRAATG
jgi:MFS transporter, PAT family, beta-lactamase induction signal transducer AmpG